MVTVAPFQLALSLFAAQSGATLTWTILAAVWLLRWLILYGLGPDERR